MKILDNIDFELAQEAAYRGTDGELFQYIGVPRRDTKGIVQIGVKPERLIKKLELVNIHDITKGIYFNEVGKMTVIDGETNKVLGCDDVTMIGQDAANFYNNELNEEQGSFWFKDDDGKTHFGYYKNSNGYKFLGTIPKANLYAGILQILYIFIGLTCFIFLTCIIIIGWIIRKKVTLELSKVTHALASIGKGDLTNQLRLTSSLEFIEISNGLNEMRSRLDDVLGDNKKNAKTLTTVGAQLGEVTLQTTLSMEQIAQGTQILATKGAEQTEKAYKGGALAEAINASIENIQEGSEESLKAVEVTHKITQTGAKLAKEQVKDMEQVEQQFRAVQLAVEKLGEQAIAIDNIVEIIQNVTEKIRLLAFNASIEAARVGEAGKGFNVVAEEVKNLANNSARATREIGNVILEIKGNISLVEKNTGQVVDAIDIQKQGVSSNVKYFEEIVGAMNISLEKVSSIQKDSQQIGFYIKGIDEFISEIKMNSEETGSIAQEINASTEEQVAIAEEVKEMSEQLTSIIEKMTASAEGFTTT